MTTGFPSPQGPRPPAEGNSLQWGDAGGFTEAGADEQSAPAPLPSPAAPSEQAPVWSDQDAPTRPRRAPEQAPAPGPRVWSPSGQQAAPVRPPEPQTQPPQDPRQDQQWGAPQDDWYAAQPAPQAYQPPPSQPRVRVNDHQGQQDGWGSGTANTEDDEDGFDHLASIFADSTDERPSRAPKAPREPRQPKAPREPRQPKPPREPRAPKPPRAPRERSAPLISRRTLIGGGLAVALLGGGVAVGGNAMGFFAKKETAATPSASPATPKIASAVPPGWTQETAWEARADVASNVAVRHGFVAFLNSGGALVVLDADKGTTAYSSTPTGMSVENSRVILAKIGDTPVAVVTQSGFLQAWDLSADNPEAKSITLPSSAAVSSGGGGVLVVSGPQTFVLGGDLNLSEVTGLPAENVSLGLTADGKVVSGSPSGGWSISSDGALAPVTPDMAPDAVGAVMYPARASKGFVVAWAPTADKETRAVAIYDAESGKIVANTPLPTAEVNLGLSLSVSDGGRLASAGTWLVDLKRGESEIVDGWSTTSSNPSGLYGTVGSAAQAWTGSGKPTALKDGTALPWGTTDDGKGIVVTRDDDGTTVVAALNPASK